MATASPISSPARYWYEGPQWTKHKFRQIDFTNNYVDDFSDLPLDVNGDGRIDIVSCSWFGKRVWWSENPGKTGAMWKDHAIESRFNVEFAFLVDLDNDGKAREVLPEFGDAKAPLTWYEARNGEFVPHVVADQSFGHGIGAGDVNKDGRNDIIVPTGWFEAPADPRTGNWNFHGDFKLGETGFIHVLDVNGDGRPDLVTSMAHNYGIFWMEQTAQGTWVKHMIDDSWSQSHSLVLADINGDGQLDLVTGKRFMAHNGRDPGEREPLGIYWYESFKNQAGQLEWVKHVIDYSSRAGAGMQVNGGEDRVHGISGCSGRRQIRACICSSGWKKPVLHAESILRLIPGTESGSGGGRRSKKSAHRQACMTGARNTPARTGGAVVRLPAP